MVLTQKAQGTCEVIKQHDIFYEFLDSDGATLEKKRISISSETFKIQKIENTACIIINSEDHGYCKVVLDSQTISFIKTSLYKVPNPVNRMLLLTNLSFMVNDCLIPAYDFVELLAFHFDNEKDTFIILFLVNLVLSTLQTKIKGREIKAKFYTFFFNKILENILIFPQFEDLLINFIYTNSQIEESVLWLRDSSPIFLNQNRR